MSVPAPSEEPRFNARELVREIQRRKGRVYRFHAALVFCLTNDAETARWLIELGGRRFIPPGFGISADGGYWRAAGIREWDIYVHTIPVRGEETVWEAAGRNRKVELRSIDEVIEP